MVAKGLRPANPQYGLNVGRADNALPEILNANYRYRSFRHFELLPKRLLSTSKANGPLARLKR